MGNKNKQQKKVTPQNDTYDVKSNLKKLGSSFDRNSYMGNGTTEDGYLSSGVNEGKSVSSYQDFDLKTNFELHTLKQDKKFTDELFSLKESVHVKINQDLKEVKNNLDKKIDCFDEKLEKKLDEKIFLWAIGALIFICSVIGVFSYFPMGSDIKDLQLNQKQINDSLNKTNNRIERLKTIVNEKKTKFLAKIKKKET